MTVCLESNALLAPLDHTFEQAHRALVRNQGGKAAIGCRQRWLLFNTHAAPDAGAVTFSLVSSNASTKLLITPNVTVRPMARSTGKLEVASSANTMSVESEHTSTACNVRRCSCGSS